MADTPQPVRTMKRGKGRSRVTNGSQLLPLADGRSTTARRFRDVYEQIATDLGGLNHLSEGQKQLCRRTEMMCAELERMEALSVRGEQVLDLAEYGRVTDTIGRCLQRLGLSRMMKDVNSQARSLDHIMNRVHALDGDTGEGDVP